MSGSAFAICVEPKIFKGQNLCIEKLRRYKDKAWKFKKFIIP